MDLFVIKTLKNHTKETFKDKLNPQKIRRLLKWYNFVLENNFLVKVNSQLKLRIKDLSRVEKISIETF